MENTEEEGSLFMKHSENQLGKSQTAEHIRKLKRKHGAIVTTDGVGGDWRMIFFIYT